MIVEPLDVINKRLKEIYGRHLDNQPHYRIVWSDDQREKRRTNFTDEGFELLFPEVRELPKYQHVPHKHLLERLIEVPFMNQDDLPDNKLTYECIWVFEDAKGRPLTPKWEMCQFVIERVHLQAARAVRVPYKDQEAIDMADPKIAHEVKEAKVNALLKELFGNETDVGDALAYDSGIVVPGPTQEKE